MSLNSSKTEIIILKHKQTIITKHINFKNSGQKINATPSVKYLGAYVNDSFTWETHFKNLILKLNKAIRLNINKINNDLQIIQLPDFISLQSSLFVNDCFEKEYPTHLPTTFSWVSPFP